MVFFKADLVATKEAPERADRRRDCVRLLDTVSDLPQRQVRLRDIQRQ